MINYMTNNIGSVKLSQEFIIIQHFRLISSGSHTSWIAEQ